MCDYVVRGCNDCSRYTLDVTLHYLYVTWVMHSCDAGLI